MSWVMPVSTWIAPGTGVPGLTSVDHCPVRAKPFASSTAISVMRSLAGSAPVVSTSTIANGCSYMDIRPVPSTLAQKRLLVAQGFEPHAQPPGMRIRGADLGARRAAGEGSEALAVIRVARIAVIVGVILVHHVH